MREHLKSAELSLQEAGYALRDYLSGLEANPGRLEEVETRLEAIARLKRKYGHTIAEILSFLEEVRGQIAGVESAGERMEALRKQRKRLASEFEKLAAALTRGAPGGGAAPGETGRGGIGATGHGANRIPRGDHGGSVVAGGRGPGGVSGVAERGRGAAPHGEGGLRRRDFADRAGTEDLPAGRRQTSVATRTLVFDEVDAGVGGSAAEGVGRRLKKLAAANQVLCVTHLPQIASFADHHYRVEKQETRGRTVAVIEELDAAARTREVGPHAERPETDAGSAEARGAVDQDERRMGLLEWWRPSGQVETRERRKSKPPALELSVDLARPAYTNATP